MNFRLVGLSALRVLMFAVAGTISMMLVSMIAGGVTGGFYPVMEALARGSWRPSDFSSYGVDAGMAVAYRIGAISGGVAFFVAGIFACFGKRPLKVFIAATSLASRAAFIGSIIGAVLGSLNNYLLNLIRDYAASDIFVGYVIGVISGFIIGVFYGALMGAKREIERQKSPATRHRVLDVAV